MTSPRNARPARDSNLKSTQPTRQPATHGCGLFFRRGGGLRAISGVVAVGASAVDCSWLAARRGLEQGVVLGTKRPICMRTSTMVQCELSNRAPDSQPM